MATRGLLNDIIYCQLDYRFFLTVEYALDLKKYMYHIRYSSLIKILDPAKAKVSSTGQLSKFRLNSQLCAR